MDKPGDSRVKGTASKELGRTLRPRNLEKEPALPGGGNLDSMPDAEGWSKSVKVARQRSPIRSASSLGEEVQAKEPMGHFGPLEFDPEALGLG